MRDKIRNLLKDHLGSLIFGFIGLAVLLVFDLGGFRSDFEKYSGEFLFGLLFLLVVVEGIFLLGKVTYIQGLEDTIRYLNAKFKLYRKLAHPDSKFSISELKPVNDDEAAPWTVKGGVAIYYGQSNYEKAVLNSRERLQKKSKER